MVWGHTWGASKVAKIAKMAIFTTTLIGSKEKIKENEIFPKSLAYDIMQDLVTFVIQHIFGLC